MIGALGATFPTHVKAVYIKQGSRNRSAVPQSEANPRIWRARARTGERLAGFHSTDTSVTGAGPRILMKETLGKPALARDPGTSEIPAPIDTMLRMGSRCRGWCGAAGLLPAARQAARSRA